MATVRPWPEVHSDEDRWSIELMEELLETTEQTPQQLRARAAELRAEAEQTTFGRDGLLALADRYELAAMKRLAAR